METKSKNRDLYRVSSTETKSKKFRKKSKKKFEKIQKKNRKNLEKFEKFCLDFVSVNPGFIRNKLKLFTSVYDATLPLSAAVSSPSYGLLEFKIHEFWNIRKFYNRIPFWANYFDNGAKSIRYA